MAALDLFNEYDDPAVANFIFQLSELEENAGFEWHVAIAGERIVSVFAGLLRAGRLSGLFFSHDTAPEVASTSPGELMVLSLAEQAIARGLDTLDFGVGEARYKSESCEIEEPMLDAAFPATVIGFAGAAAFLLARRFKRRIKHSPRLFEAARSVQRLLFRRRAR